MAKIPTTNISWDVIRNTLNAAGGSVTNDIKTGFVEAAKYCKWARWKPRIYAADFVPVGDVNASPQSWRASDGRCGLILPLLTVAQSVKGLDPEVEWKRNPPTGGTYAPLRIDDYGGYNTEARHPINSFTRSGIASDNVVYFDTDPPVDDGDTLPFAVGVHCKLHDNRGTDALDITDFKYLSETTIAGMYFGVIVSKDGGSNSNFCSWVTLGRTLQSLINAGDSDVLYPYGDDLKGPGMRIEIPYDSFRIRNADHSYNYAGEGAYTLYPCMFYESNPYTETGNESLRGSVQNITFGQSFIPLPVSPISINVVRVTSFIDVAIVSAVRNATASTNYATVLDIIVKITNNTDSGSFTFANYTGSLNYVKVGLSKIQGDGTIYWTTPSQDFTVPAGRSTTITFTTLSTEIIPYSDRQANAHIQVIFQGNSINRGALATW